MFNPPPGHEFYWMDMLLILVALAGIVLAFIHRIKTRMGFGLRFIQVLAVVTLVPFVAILGLEGKISAEVGTLLGTVAGFCLGGLKEGGE
jgi:hypothetical protein